MKVVSSRGARAAPEVTVPDSCAPEAQPVTFDQLYDAHVDFLWRNARRLGVQDDAVDDVLQQLFLVVYRRLPELKMAGSEKAWLFGVLTRVVRDHHRLLRRKSPHRFFRATDPATLVDEQTRQPDEALARVQAATAVQRCLDQLDEDKRRVFILAEIEQLPAREIAEATGTNQSTVYSRLRVARLEFEAAAVRYRKKDGRRP